MGFFRDKFDNFIDKMKNITRKEEAERERKDFLKIVIVIGSVFAALQLTLWFSLWYFRSRVGLESFLYVPLGVAMYIAVYLLPVSIFNLAMISWRFDMIYRHHVAWGRTKGMERMKKALFCWVKLVIGPILTLGTLWKLETRRKVTNHALVELKGEKGKVVDREEYENTCNEIKRLKKEIKRLKRNPPCVLRGNKV